MKIMKIVSIFAIILGFSQCGSSKFVKNPSFKIEKAVYNHWTGGQPGVSGTKLEIHISNASEVEFDSVFFQQKETKVEVSKNGNKTILIGHFSTSTREKRDFVLDADPTKELKNTPPNIEKSKFDLKETEAVLSYKKGDKVHYYKITGILQTQSSFFPSAKQK
ncbi:hypothetical protein JL193_09385 [Polaribacter batillariae]|uniref:Lipoprotein n=1 Tax=Polaribacter batillariae TaxID=2808900 RepID=A0ABX7SR89_9FLAO|nr:hypothetical protein [Polaribacter batillariae]QTD36372.1 hypothetical protein JL193_09385 [Polaribacter batillariae]